MTTNISSINFKQPSFEDYLNAKTLKELPFRVRARIINTFERLGRVRAEAVSNSSASDAVSKSASLPKHLTRGANASVGSTAAVNILNSEPSVTSKSAPRVKLKPRFTKPEPTKYSSYKSSETVFAFKHIKREQSSGKGRPTKRTKIALKRVARTVRRFKGGQDDGSKVRF